MTNPEAREQYELKHGLLQNVRARLCHFPGRPDLVREERWLENELERLAPAAGIQHPAPKR